jgi:hypothetical protein
VSASQRISAVAPRPAPAPPPPPPSRPLDDNELLEAAPIVKIDPIRSVVPLAALLGESKGGARIAPADFIEAVMSAAVGGGKVPQMPGDIGRLADGTWVTRFPSTVPQQVVPHKLTVLRETWGVVIEQPEPTRIVLRKVASTSLWGAWSGKRHGLEVVVQLPQQGRGAGEVTATGTTFGTPDPQFQKVATDQLPKILTDVRRELQNVEDRRKNPRVATAMPITLYPIHADGSVDNPIPAQSRDVSAGGVCLTAAVRLPTKYSYLVFDGVPAVSGLGLLARLIRLPSPDGDQDHVAAVRFRTDL